MKQDNSNPRRWYKISYRILSSFFKIATLPVGVCQPKTSLSDNSLLALALQSQKVYLDFLFTSFPK